MYHDAERVRPALGVLRKTSNEVQKSIKKNIQNGAELLDRKLPGWRKRLDLQTLDIEWSERCVLGQCYGDYEHGLMALDIAPDCASGYGFFADRERDGYGFDELTAGWMIFLEFEQNREHIKEAA